MITYDPRQIGDGPGIRLGNGRCQFEAIFEAIKDAFLKPDQPVEHPNS